MNETRSGISESIRNTVPSVSVSYARNGGSTKANALGMRPMQERAYEKRGEQYLLIKSPPASGKSRALMFIALDKRSEEHTSELQSLTNIVCRLLLEKKKMENDPLRRAKLR